MTKRTSLIHIAFVLTLVFTILQWFALSFYFYWTIWWFDLLMHLFAGFLGGLAVYWVLFNSGVFFRKGIPRLHKKMLIVLGYVLFVGLAWEVLEYFYKLIEVFDQYPVDPIIDLFLGGVGSVVAVMVGDRIDSSNV